MTSADALSPASQSENRCHFFYCIIAAAHQLIRCITAVTRGLPLSHVAHLLPHGGRSKKHSGVSYPLSLEPSLPTGLFRSESGRQPLTTILRNASGAYMTHQQKNAQLPTHRQGKISYSRTGSVACATRLLL